VFFCQNLLTQKSLDCACNLKNLWYNVDIRVRQKEKRKKMKNKFPIIEKAKRQARMCFLGIAIPTVVKSIDGEMVQVEKVIKFNRTALKNIGKRKTENVDPRFVGGVDGMRFKVGKPGSAERVAALTAQYASLSEDEMSPFED
jgi:hypothetical protein